MLLHAGAIQHDNEATLFSGAEEAVRRAEAAESRANEAEAELARLRNLNMIYEAILHAHCEVHEKALMRAKAAESRADKAEAEGRSICVLLQKLGKYNEHARAQRALSSVDEPAKTSQSLRAPIFQSACGYSERKRAAELPSASCSVIKKSRGAKLSKPIQERNNNSVRAAPLAKPIERSGDDHLDRAAT